MIHAAQRALLACAIFVTLSVSCVFAQEMLPAAAPALTTMPDSNAKTSVAQQTSDVAASLDDVRKQLREQHAEIERLRATLTEQTHLLNELLTRTPRVDTSRTTTGTTGATVKEAVNSTHGITATDTFRATPLSAGKAVKNPQADQTDTRVRAVEAQAQKTTETLARQLGSISFSGDIRLRYESQFGGLNALANAENPAIFGNELSARHRARLRARLALRGQIGQEFDWGLRIATGALSDVTSTNQTSQTFSATNSSRSIKPISLINRQRFRGCVCKAESLRRRGSSPR